MKRVLSFGVLVLVLGCSSGGGGGGGGAAGDGGADDLDTGAGAESGAAEFVLNADEQSSLAASATLPDGTQYEYWVDRDRSGRITHLSDLSSVSPSGEEYYFQFDADGRPVFVQTPSGASVMVHAYLDSKRADVTTTSPGGDPERMIINLHTGLSEERGLAKELPRLQSTYPDACGAIHSVAEVVCPVATAIGVFSILNGILPGAGDVAQHLACEGLTGFGSNIDIESCADLPGGAITGYIQLSPEDPEPPRWHYWETFPSGNWPSPNGLVFDFKDQLREVQLGLTREEAAQQMKDGASLVGGDLDVIMVVFNDVLPASRETLMLDARFSDPNSGDSLRVQLYIEFDGSLGIERDGDATFDFTQAARAVIVGETGALAGEEGWFESRRSGEYSGTYDAISERLTWHTAVGTWEDTASDGSRASGRLEPPENAWSRVD